MPARRIAELEAGVRAVLINYIIISKKYFAAAMSSPFKDEKVRVEQNPTTDILPLTSV